MSLSWRADSGGAWSPVPRRPEQPQARRASPAPPVWPLESVPPSGRTRRGALEDTYPWVKAPWGLSPAPQSPQHTAVGPPGRIQHPTSGCETPGLLRGPPSTWPGSSTLTPPLTAAGQASPFPDSTIKTINPLKAQFPVISMSKLRRENAFSFQRPDAVRHNYRTLYFIILLI